MRRTSPTSAAWASAFLTEICMRSMPTGFTQKSIAPARIADTTVSIEPCAVSTITGTLMPRSFMRFKTPRAVEIGHHEIEDHAGDTRALVAAELLQRGLAVIERLRLVAETLQHRFHETPLHRIVVRQRERAYS